MGITVPTLGVAGISLFEPRQSNFDLDVSLMVNFSFGYVVVTLPIKQKSSVLLLPIYR